MEEQERVEKALPGGIRIEEDGSLNFGDGCLIIKPDGQDIRVKVSKSKCGEEMAAAYRDLIEATVGKGGKTVYEVEAEIEKAPLLKGKLIEPETEPPVTPAVT